MLYPITTKSRTLTDLSGIWKIKFDDGDGFSNEWYKVELKDALNIAVPSSYNDLFEGVDKRDHYGYVFYQRSLSIPKILENERLVLRFEAVTNEAVVYLNGELIIKHKGGYLPFEIEINDKVVIGENLLTVAVNNVIDDSTLPVGSDLPMLSGMLGGIPSGGKKANSPNFDFFNYCGINRPVKLYTTPKNYIKDINITNEFINDYSKAFLTYDIECVGEGSGGVSIIDINGEVVAKSDSLSGKLCVDNPRLWEPLNSYLYKLVVTFNDDLYILPYGIREVKVIGNRFLINGKSFYFKGYGKHEDTFPNGRGVNMPMNCKDISLMKWQNANSFRTSHYPYSEEMMRLCDEEGIVVIDETPAVGINYTFGGGANFGGQKVSTFDKEHGVKTFYHHKEVIKDMIDRDKNFACVVMWSIANEPDSFSEGAYEYFEPLFKYAKELDPQNRPCTMVSVQMGNGPDNDISVKLSDVICLNRYYGWYFGGPDLNEAKYALIDEMNKWEKVNKPVMFTEYGADTIIGFHETTPTMYTEEYQIEFYKVNNDVLDSYNFVIGEQVWNFADFATSQSLLRINGNKKGIFTRDRKPKMVAYYLKERWKMIPDFDYKNK